MIKTNLNSGEKSKTGEKASAEILNAAYVMKNGKMTTVVMLCDIVLCSFAVGLQHRVLRVHYTATIPKRIALGVIG